MAVVHYSGRNRIALHVDEMVDVPGENIKVARRGPSVEIGPGRNEVGDDFWKAWSEQNKGGGMLARGVLRAEEPDHENRSDHGVVSSEEDPHKPVQ